MHSHARRGRCGSASLRARVGVWGWMGWCGAGAARSVQWQVPETGNALGAKKAKKAQARHSFARVAQLLKRSGAGPVRLGSGTGWQCDQEAPLGWCQCVCANGCALGCAAVRSKARASGGPARPAKGLAMRGCLAAVSQVGNRGRAGGRRRVVITGEWSENNGSPLWARSTCSGLACWRTAPLCWQRAGRAARLDRPRRRLQAQQLNSVRGPASHGRPPSRSRAGSVQGCWLGSVASACALSRVSGVQWKGGSQWLRIFAVVAQACCAGLTLARCRTQPARCAVAAGHARCAVCR